MTFSVRVAHYCMKHALTAAYAHVSARQPSGLLDHDVLQDLVVEDLSQL